MIAFGPPPKDHATGKLPQHGFARSVLWEFLGKNTSESRSGDDVGLKGVDEEVKLDFGLSTGMLSQDMRDKWPYDFGLVYSVTLGRGTLETGFDTFRAMKGAEEFIAMVGVREQAFAAAMFEARLDAAPSDDSVTRAVACLPEA